MIWGKCISFKNLPTAHQILTTFTSEARFLASVIENLSDVPKIQKYFCVCGEGVGIEGHKNV